MLRRLALASLLVSAACTGDGPETAALVTSGDGRDGATVVGRTVNDTRRPTSRQNPTATSDPRFLVMARSGPLPAEARAAAESYLRAHAASAH